ncbi:phosphotransferase family protein [Parapedomonas caeni]
MDEIRQRFARYLAARMEGITDVEIVTAARLHGGASRETYRLRARYLQEGATVERGFVLRRDPTGSLIETERDVEYNAYRAYHGTDVPVPEPLFLEMDGQWLDRPFFVMEEITGCTAAPPFQPDPYGPLRDRIGTQFWNILGAIHRADPAARGLTRCLDMPAPADCWRQALDYWAAVIDADALSPQPIVQGAIRWLRRNPPPAPPRVTVIHGDYRTGNFLYDDTGTIRAVLDWEMCHLGDPHEDIAWAADPLWAFGDPTRAGTMIPTEEGLRLWTQASGMAVNPESLRWWQVFAMVKGLAIWLSSSREYATGSNRDPILAFSGWFCTAAHNRMLAERLRDLTLEECAA